MFNNISSQIQEKLLKTYSCRREKEKQFTAMRIMVNMIKKNWDQVGSQYYFLVHKIKWNLPIWEFLFDNLSYRYEKNTIDYDSLTKTYSKMEELVAANPKDVCFNDELGNLCALFATYLAIMGSKEIMGYWIFRITERSPLSAQFILIQNIFKFIDNSVEKVRKLVFQPVFLKDFLLKLAGAQYESIVNEYFKYNHLLEGSQILLDT